MWTFGLSRTEIRLIVNFLKVIVVPSQGPLAIRSCVRPIGRTQKRGHWLFLRRIWRGFLEHFYHALVEVIDVLFGLIGKRVAARAPPDSFFAAVSDRSTTRVHRTEMGCQLRVLG